MVGRILMYLSFVFLIAAFVLSFAGVSEVYLGNGFQSWLKFVASKYNAWSFKIPNIPDIRMLGTAGETGTKTQIDMNGDGKVVVGEFFAFIFNGRESVPKKILNTIIFFFNFSINILNLVVRLLNIVIQVVQFVLTMVYCVSKLPDYLSGSEWLRWNNEGSIWWWPSVGSARTIV